MRKREIRAMRLDALKRKVASMEPEAVSWPGPWCCERGEASGVQVCEDCAEASAGYSAAMQPERTTSTGERSHG